MCPGEGRRLQHFYYEQRHNFGMRVLSTPEYLTAGAECGGNSGRVVEETKVMFLFESGRRKGTVYLVIGPPCTGRKNVDSSADRNEFLI